MIQSSPEELLAHLGFNENSPNTYIKRNITNDGFDCVSAGQAGISSSITGLIVKCISNNELEIEKGYCLDDTYFLNMYNPTSKIISLPVNKDTTIHLFLISTLNGEIKIFYSENINPKLPVGYFYKRRFWSIVIQNNKIKQFIQNGNKCHFLSPTVDYFGFLPIGTSKIKIPLPEGLKTDVELMNTAYKLNNDYELYLESSLINYQNKINDELKLYLFSNNEIKYNLKTSSDDLYNTNLCLTVKTLGYIDDRYV